METGHQFGIAFRQVERRSVCLGERGDQKEDKGERLSEDVPTPRSRALVADDVVQVDRPGNHEEAHDGEPQRDFVADHLRGGAKPSQQGILVVRGPAGQHDPVDRERCHGKDIENPDVQVGDPERGGKIPQLQVVPERDDGGHDEIDEHGDERGEDKVKAVRPRRKEFFLHEELDRVGDVMNHPAEPNSEDIRPIRPPPVLKIGGPFAFHPNQDLDKPEDNTKDGDDFDGGDDDFENEVHGPGFCYREIRGESSPNIPFGTCERRVEAPSNRSCREFPSEAAGSSE